MPGYNPFDVVSRKAAAKHFRRKRARFALERVCDSRLVRPDVVLGQAGTTTDGLEAGIG